MINPTTAAAALASSASIASAGVGAAAQAVATPKARRAAGSAASNARQAAGAGIVGGPVRPPRTRVPTTIRRLPIPGYAAATATAAASSEFAFLKDPKLSLEDKLMKLLVQLNKQWEADIQKHMEEVAASKTKKSATKKKGVFGQLADVASKLLGPVAGEVLRAPGVGPALSKLAGPVVTAAAAAVGGPGFAAILAKAAPAIVNGLAAATGAAAAQGSAAAPGTLSEKEVEAKLMEINRLKNHQDEMFRLVSQMIRSSHDTRLNIIGNLR